MAVSCIGVLGAIFLRHCRLTRNQFLRCNCKQYSTFFAATSRPHLSEVQRPLPGRQGSERGNTQIDIHALNFTLTDGLRARVKHRLRFALARFQDQMDAISVRLSDVKGGIDKRCMVRIKAKGLPDIVVADTEADLYVAVDQVSSPSCWRCWPWICSSWAVTVSVKETGAWVATWVTLALTFAALLWWHLDGTAGREIANLRTLEFLAH